MATTSCQGTLLGRHKTALFGLISEAELGAISWPLTESRLPQCNKLEQGDGGGEGARGEGQGVAWARPAVGHWVFTLVYGQRRQRRQRRLLISAKTELDFENVLLIFQ